MFTSLTALRLNYEEKKIETSVLQTHKQTRKPSVLRSWFDAMPLLTYGYRVRRDVITIKGRITAENARNFCSFRIHL